MIVVATSIGAFLMAIFANIVRMKAAKKPATVKKIVLPPLFMSTGALMFVFPMFRVTWGEAAEAFIIGSIFSIFLIKTSNFEIRDQQIYLKRSKAFIFILFGLLFVRIILKTVLGQYISLGETSGMFFLLAFGMILFWRIGMYVSFKRLKRQLDAEMNISQ